MDCAPAGSFDPKAKRIVALRYETVPAAIVRLGWSGVNVVTTGLALHCYPEPRRPPEHANRPRYAVGADSITKSVISSTMDFLPTPEIFGHGRFAQYSNIAIRIRVNSPMNTPSLPNLNPI